MNNTFVFKYDDKNILRNSSSGGAFSAISDYVLQSNGIIAGVIYDYQNNSAKHIITDNKCDRNLMCGSKYFQSDMNDCLKKVEQALSLNKMVLFTGTICQIAGLKKYLDLKAVNTEQLICCDIICHGVASPLVWKDYITYKSQGKKIEQINFRNKKNGWKNSLAIARIDKTIINLSDYMKLFYSHTIMRPSCHSCPFTNIVRCSDITIGDFWGIENVKIDFSYYNGVSFLMLNNEKAKSIFANVIRSNPKIQIKECNIKDVQQPNLYYPTKASVIRTYFWKEYKKRGIIFILKKYANDNIFRKSEVTVNKVFFSIIYKCKERINICRKGKK